MGKNPRVTTTHRRSILSKPNVNRAARSPKNRHSNKAAQAVSSVEIRLSPNQLIPLLLQTPQTIFFNFSRKSHVKSQNHLTCWRIIKLQLAQLPRSIRYTGYIDQKKHP
jgi:hypothetical protein